MKKKKKDKVPFIQFGKYSNIDFKQISLGICYTNEPLLHNHIIIDLFKWYIEFTFNQSGTNKHGRKLLKRL